MDKILLGSLFGVVAGDIAVAMMLPMKFPDRRAALLGAFCNRFLIGFVVGISVLPPAPRRRRADWLSGQPPRRHHHQSLRADPDPRHRLRRPDRAGRGGLGA